MTLYLSAERLKRALTKLAKSRVKQGRLLDYLIVKRTLTSKAEASVAITTSEPAFILALDEMAGVRDTEGEFIDEAKPYLNVFAIEDSRSGYRSPKFKSNGTNTTIGKTEWQRHVIQFDDSSPRKTSLKDGYESHLADLLLTGNEKEPKPNLCETALWYFRGQDIEPVIGSAPDLKGRLELLANEFVARTGLTDAEIDAIFDRDIDDTEAPDAPAIVNDAADPTEYLPGRVARSPRAAAEDLSVASFDLVAALAAKNFVILTGPSGTGKSRAALKLAEGLQVFYADKLTLPIFELVPVGPDWTSPKRLLGYKTPFGKERTGEDGATTNESYEITATLRLILRASHPDNAGIPHFLIFDEMNLSHVERYFAPFLSLMEAANILDDEGGVSLIDGDDFSLVAQLLEDEDPSSREAEAAKTMLTEGRSFVLPPNLFFVGTVNVDETTYMFSPKVLDRAHVIELNAERPSAYLTSAASIEPGGLIAIEVANALLKEGVENRKSQRLELPNPANIISYASDYGMTDEEIQRIRAQVIAALDGCYDLLAPVGYPFGYRISKEVFAYLLSWLAAKHAAGVPKAEIFETWPEALDRALLQKVLPKLHGNRRLLSDSLRALSAFLAGSHSGSTPAASYNLGVGTTIGVPESGKLQLPGPNPYLPLSRKKLDAMQDRLNATGYVSFVN